jgi:putative drug exporter of the RND superfamily
MGMSALVRLSVRRAGWVIVAWLAVIVGLNLAVPQLETVIARDSTEFVPGDAPSMKAFSEMDQAFGSGDSKSVVFVVAERAGGLTPDDRAWVRGLAADLRTDDEHVTFVADVARPGMLKALESRDREAIYLQVGIPGATGAPAATRQIATVRDSAATGVPDGLDVAVTGPAATITDMQHEIETSILTITLVTIGLIALILMLIYRSIAVTAVVLGFIGATLAASRAVTAWAGLNLFHVSTFTASFLTAVVLGAGTDYAIFLLSRYHEQLRAGMDPRQAVVTATRKVSSVIVGSALTVMVASACMLLADVGIFNTTGPAVAVSIGVTLVLCLTLLPATLAVAGSRGWLAPRPARGELRWRRVAATVVARPGRVLLAGLVPLLLLAAFYPQLEPSFDERGTQPEETESNQGYALLAAHYPANEVLADYVTIRADHDLRNSRDLAALEKAAVSVAGTDGVASVRTVTRPLGTPIDRASLGRQFRAAGERLGGAAARLTSGAGRAEELSSGAGQLRDGAGRLANGADRAAAGAGRLVGGLSRLADGMDRIAAGATDARAGSGELHAGAVALADGLTAGYEQAGLAVDGLGMAYDALRRSVTCGLDPVCRRARDGIRQVYEGERDQLLPGLRSAASAARRIANGTVSLQDGLAQLDAGLDRARAGADRLAAGQATMASRLGDLADGADQVADGSARVAGGTAEMTGSVGELRTGLTRAATYLRTTGKAASDPAIGGFYLPPRAFDDPRFALATGLFLSQDGRMARLVVLGESDAFGTEASARTAAIREAAQVGLRGTRLENSEVQTSGLPSVNADLDELSRSDFWLVSGVSLLAVFLILLVLLRSIVAATFLLGSVALSYASAIGLGVLVWQYALGIPLDWTVPAIAFVLLVAVGADYNMLLIKRMREEAPDGSAEGFARALSVTGGVITSAGVIFAASMFALMAGSVTTLAQIGFTIGMGLLLDTFVVRTLVVPAFAALMGPRLWWPAVPATGGPAVVRPTASDAHR